MAGGIFTPTGATGAGGQVQLGLEERLRAGQDASLADRDEPVQLRGGANPLPLNIGRKQGTTLRGARNRLYSMTQQEVAALQAELAEAGLIPEEAIANDKVAWGSATDTFTEAAWANLIGIHLRDKRKSVMGHLEERRRTNAPRWQALQTKMASGEGATITVSAPSDVNARADDAAQRLLGRKATPEEKARLVQFVQGGELAAGEQKVAAAAPQGVGAVNDLTGAKVANEMAGRFGLSVTSTIRSPEKNRQVKGAKNSDHLPGGAFAADFSGDAKQMNAFAAWARQQQGPGKMFKKVIYGTGDHKDHVHVTYNENPSGVPVGGIGGDDVDQFMASTRQQESGNRYDWNLTSKAGARGAYQFRPGTWLEAARLAGVDVKDHSPAAQDAAARALMSKYHAEFGDWSLVAIAWHAGPGTARKVKASGGTSGTNDGLINTDDYARQVVGRMGSIGGGRPASTMEGVTVTENFGGETSIEEELRRQNPVEAAGHDVAGAFGSFVKLLNGPVG